MTDVQLVCIAMAGNEYVLWDRAGAWSFPEGALAEGEAPADAARRLVLEWTGTRAPKLELVDLLASAGKLTLVMRAMLTDEPQHAPKRAKRFELPEKVGTLTGKYVEEALKTGLNYKLTRV